MKSKINRTSFAVLTFLTLTASFLIGPSASPANAWDYWRAERYSSASSVWGWCWGGTSKAFYVTAQCSWMGLGIGAYPIKGNVARYDESIAKCRSSWDHAKGPGSSSTPPDPNREGRVPDPPLSGPLSFLHPL